MRFLHLLPLLASCAAAHDIPADVAIHAFVRPAGERLQVLVRAPLKVVRDLDFPRQANGYLDVEALAPMLADAARLWIADSLRLMEDGRRLPSPTIAATQISLPSDRSFASFDQALARVHGDHPPNSANLVWDQVLFDVLLEFPVRTANARFAIEPGWHRLGEDVATVLRFIPPGGAVRAYEFTGDPGRILLDPRWHQAAASFVRRGFFHILEGIDHLLFLLCLVIPLRRLRPLVLVVTAFTVAHSVTLTASALGAAPDALWFPPLIETLIAVSILYMAIENIAAEPTVRRRWMLAFAFGLVHGFGFSFALRETMQFAGAHLWTSLAGFNAGVELGQILVIAVLVPALSLLFRYVLAERLGIIILSVLVAHTAWHWMTERAALLGQYPAFRP